MNKTAEKGYITIIGLFTVLCLLIFLVKDFLIDHGFDRNVLNIANVVLFLITITGFWLQQRALKSANPNVFVRSVYASMIIKLFVCMIVVFAYAFMFKDHLNKPSLFAGMAMYILYTIIEVSALTKALRKNKNA